MSFWKREIKHQNQESMEVNEVKNPSPEMTFAFWNDIYLQNTAKNP